MAIKPVSESLRQIGIFIGVLWGIYLLDWVVPGQFTDWGIIPRSLRGLIGIPLSPLLHDGVGHLISNSIPLVILLGLFLASRKTPWVRVAEIAILGGALLWLFGRSESENAVAVHVGASGLIYGLIAYLIVAGFRERHPVSLLVALVVGFLYGGTLLWGVLPMDARVSWDGHLFGAIAGGALAFLLPAELDSPER